MGYICLSCFNEFYKDGLNLNLYKDYRYKCPLCTCGDLNVVEVDDMLLPIIKKLNLKGYITKYCCSGHSYVNNTDTYIAFNIDTVPKIIPKDFVLENEEYYKENNWTFIGDMICIRKSYEDIPKNEIHEELLKTHLELIRWVDLLEDNSEEGRLKWKFM